MKSEHLRNAERIAEDAEALAARCAVADRDEPFMWGLMYVDDGRPYYAEYCVGSERDMREEAINHNRCAEEVGETDLIAAVPMWLREGGTNAKVEMLHECCGCGHIRQGEISRCDCGSNEFIAYNAVMHRAHI